VLIPWRKGQTVLQAHGDNTYTVSLIKNKFTTPNIWYDKTFISKTKDFVMIQQEYQYNCCGKVMHLFLVAVR
jgi:hypothetical protein